MFSNLNVVVGRRVKLRLLVDYFNEEESLVAHKF